MLYKYVGATSVEDTLTLLKYFIEDLTLKISEPFTFNDPFEFKVNVDFTADEDTKRAAFFKHHDNIGATEADFQKWLEEFNEHSIWWQNQSLRSETLRRFGVLCLTSLDDNHLMWSHYAANHTGFCIGFDETELLKMDKIEYSGFITYQDDAPTFRYYFDDPQLLTKLLSSTKSSQWHYEKEFRVLFDKKGPTEFPHTALREVILGCRSSQVLRKYAKEKLVNSNCRFYLMGEEYGAYRLRKMPIQKNLNVSSSFF